MNGKTVNGYKILRMLGSGGMADVYFAENILEMPAAIKVLKKKYYDDKSIRDRFKNEALIMKSLDHPYIRKVIDYFENDGYAMIVMEFVEGMTLKDLMDVKKTISDETVHKYFEQCISALNYTHSRGIVHRDIKPSNIFITTAGDVKLVDYGIAKSDSGNSHTVTGQTLGTVIYMSPEQIIDPKRVTYKTDIYSLGVTFYHLLTGRPPYHEKTGSEYIIQSKIVNESLDMTVVPEKWRSILKTCLVKNPLDRKLILNEGFVGATSIEYKHTRSKPTQSVKSKYFIYILAISFLAITTLVYLYFQNVKVGRFLGNPYAEFLTGEKYYKELIYNEAEYWYNKSAAQGNGYGQYGLGKIAYYGVKGKSDTIKAIEWFTLSAMNDCPKGETAMGVIYLNGYGVKRDSLEALRWFNKSADKGEAKAMAILGRSYEEGNGVPKDIAKARILYSKACQKGHSEACERLKVL